MSLGQQLYYINTLLKDSGTNEQFSYSIQIPSSAAFDRVVLLQATIPNTFYLIQDGFNTFTLQEANVSTTITIPSGNYSAKVFASVVSGLMTSASPNQWVYGISLADPKSQAQTGKFSYSVTGNTSQPSIICTVNVNEQLGFAVNSTNTFVNGALTSSTTVNFGAESTLFIHSDLVRGSNDILQEVYAGNTESLSYITYQCTAPELYSKVLSTSQSNTFHFTLTNEKDQLLDLHGVDMLLTIALYKKDDTNQLIRKYIKYKAQTLAETQADADA